MPFHPDWRRIEVVDEAVAEVLRQRTPAERMAIGFGLFESARKFLSLQLGSMNPDWDQERVAREVARRLSHGAV
jgi:stage V sporulation protein SpoVS